MSCDSSMDNSKSIQKCAKIDDLNFKVKQNEMDGMKKAEKKKSASHRAPVQFTGST